MVGWMLVILRSGTTMSSTLVIDVSPFRITNTYATDVRVAATGITVGATTIDVDNNLVRIPVNAGATAGSIRVEGIRVSVAGTGASSIGAKLSWENGLNLFSSGRNLTLVNAVQTGLAADPITDRFLVFNGQVVHATSTISLREGYASAWTNSRDFGQTVPASVRIRVTELPANLQLTFPSSVTARNSGATLTTSEGVVTLPRANGNAEVIYNFAGTSESNNIVEAFDILFTAALTGFPGTSQPMIEVGLGPIGTAMPDPGLPSPVVPRFAKEDIVVQEGSSRIITKVLYWSGINSLMQNQVNLFNPSSNVANLTIDAFNASGTAVTDPVKLSLAANQSIVRTTAELFGVSTSIASIRVQSTGPDVLATAVVSDTGRSESIPFESHTMASFIVPVVNQGAQLSLFNPNSAPVSGTLTLRTEEGQTVSSPRVTLNPLASTTLAVGGLFNGPSRGYISGDFPAPVAAFESFGDGNTLNLLAMQPLAAAATFYVPLYVNGNGFQTDVNLINVSDDTATLTGQLYSGTGAPVEPAVLITMPPRQQLVASVGQIFPQTAPIGFIRFDLPFSSRGIFSNYPPISGHVQIRSAQGGSTVVPLSTFPLQDVYILGSGTAASEFEGITLINPSATAVTVSLQGLNSSGTTAGAFSLTLNPGQVVSRLITEFFSGGLPAQSVIRITSSAPIVTSAITGSNSLDTLRSLPVLR